MNPSLRHATTLSAVAFILGAGTALAGPVYVSPGQTKVVNVSADVRFAKAADDRLVDVKRRAGGQVVLRGKELGRTEVRMRMADGEEYTLSLHVVPEGTVVYSTGRGNLTAKLERSEKKQKVTSDSDKVREAAAAERETSGTGAKDDEGDIESWARGAQP